MTSAWSLLYGAYEYIRANVSPVTSSTAQMLQTPDWRRLRVRLADELGELAGVLDGSHRHQGLPDDLILEASQVCYWTFVQAVGAGYTLAEIAPVEPSDADLRELAAIIGVGEQPLSRTEAQTVWAAALGACQAGGTDSAAVCLYDLEQMHSRTYLQPYFAAQEQSG